MAKSQKHLRAVRKLPCCICGNTHTVEAHHLRSLDYGRGMGLKSGDEWAVPLCKKHHDECHTHGTKMEPTFFASYSVQADLLAEELWSAWESDDSEQLMLWSVVSYIGGDK